jgi:hypothetical protein
MKKAVLKSRMKMSFSLQKLPGTAGNTEAETGVLDPSPKLLGVHMSGTATCSEGREGRFTV